MTRHEDQLAICRPLRVPPQILFGRSRAAVFVGAQKREIQVVSRIGEIIGIAAEKCSLLFRREHQSHIGIFFISVQPILTTGVKRHYIRSKVGRDKTLLLDPGPFPLTRIKRLLFGHARLHHALNAGGNVLHRHQHVEFEIRTLQLLRLGSRIEAVADIVFLCIGKFLKLAERHMVIRNRKTIGADKRTRTAVIEADARESHMIQPLLSRREPVPVLQLLQRGIVECPHPLIRCDARRACKRNQKQQDGKRRAPHFHKNHLEWYLKTMPRSGEGCPAACG